jgi:hypothetical protein
MREMTKTELELINIIRKSDDPASALLIAIEMVREYLKAHPVSISIS